MAKKPYRRNHQNHSTESRSSMISIPCKEYEALIQHRAENNMVRLYLQKETSTYVDGDTIRLILGIKKEA